MFVVASLRHYLIMCPSNFAMLQGLGSLLGAGVLSMVPSVREALAMTSHAIPPPSIKPNTIQRLLQRECGTMHRFNTRLGLLPPSVPIKHWTHQKTIRGHRFAVYCVTMDPGGRYFVTGSDDGLVKVGGGRVLILVWNLFALVPKDTGFVLKTRVLLCQGPIRTSVWTLVITSTGSHTV